MNRFNWNDPKIRRLAMLAAVLLVTFLAFSPSLWNSFFHLDDEAHVLENPSIRGLDLSHLKAMFTRTNLKIYVPLTYISYALEYKFFEYQPFVYHFDNLLLHLGVTLLVFVLARRWGLSLAAAGIASLIFGIHPMHVESVAWITERKDVLYSLFYLLAVYHYLNYLKWEEAANQPVTRAKGKIPTPADDFAKLYRRKKFISYSWVILFGLLSILSKPMALSLPFILFLCDWFKQRRFWPGVFIDKIPHFLYIVPVAWVTYAFHRRIPGRNLAEGSLIWIWSLTFYLKKFFFPFHVYPAYTMPQPISIFEPDYFLAVLIFAALIFCLYQFRRDKWFIFAFLYFFGSIFFLLRFDTLFDAHMVADRFIYLPCLGICLWIGYRVADFFGQGGPARKKLIGLAVAAVAVALFAKTFTQTQLWGREYDLWTKILEIDPRSFFAYNSRGSLYSDEKNHEAAISDYSKAIQYSPRYAIAYNNRGISYYEIGEKDLALTDFNKALALNSSYDYVYVNRSLIYTDLKKFDLALQDLKKAVQLNPENAYTYNNLGRIYFVMGKYDQALEEFNKALSLKKDLAKTYVSRGNVYMLKNRLDLAFKDFSRALSYDPKHAGAYYNRSLAYYLQKKFPEALKDAKQAKALGYQVQESYLKNIQAFVDNPLLPAVGEDQCPTCEKKASAGQNDQLKPKDKLPAAKFPGL